MPPVTLVVLIFLVAMVYASVGHGGASGYLAVLSLFGYDPARMATSALVLNLLVAGLAFLSFWRSGHFSSSLTWPFLIASIPAAVVGGWLPISWHAYHMLLAIVLGVAALRLWLKPPATEAVRGGPERLIALPVGAGIGFVSGIVGVGGGIFLSPIMLLCRWADAKRTAATAAGFIVLNSAAGLVGRLMAGRFEIGALLPLVAAAFTGGVIGSRVGSNHVSNLWVCRLLAVVLVVAAGKLALGHG